MTAICLSDRVAEAAAALPWRAIRLAARPDLPSLLEAIPMTRGEQPQPDRMKV